MKTVAWLALALSFTPLLAQAATVTLTTSDASAASSFASAGHWSNAAAPSSGNDYLVSSSGTTLLLRTANDAVSRTFAGNSLTIDGSAAQFGIKANGASTITVGTAGMTTGGLTLSNGGTLNQGSAVSGTNLGVTTTFAGNIIVGTGGGTITSNNGFGTAVNVTEGLTIASTLSGSGSLSLSNSTSVNSNPGYIFDLTFTGNNSLFSGAVNLLNNSLLSTNGNTSGKPFTLVVEVGASSSLGTGAVTVAGAASATVATTLTLDNNTAVSNSLTIGDATKINWLLNLNFTGTDVVSSLTINGVTYAAGTVIDASTPGISGISGTGSLTVAPEPSAIALLLVGIGSVTLLGRRRLSC